MVHEQLLGEQTTNAILLHATAAFQSHLLKCNVNIVSMDRSIYRPLLRQIFLYAHS